MRTTMTTMAALALAASTLLAPSAVAQDDAHEPWEMRLHDVSDLAPATNAPLRRRLGDVGLFKVWTSRYSPSELALQLDESSAAHRFSIDDLTSLISSVVNEADENADVDEAEGRIRVRATAAGQRRAAAALQVLRRAAGGPYTIEIEELVLPDLSRIVATPDDATLAAWRASDVRGGPRYLGMTLEPGCWRTAEDVSGVRSVVDVDVEIAQDARIADPIVVRVETGTRVIARAHPLLDGRVVVRVLASVADLHGEPRRVALGEDELGAVDLADLEGGLVSTEVALAPGSATSIVVARPEGATRVLVLRLRGEPAERVGGTLRVLPHGAISAAVPEIRLAVGDEPWLDGRPAFALEEAEGPEVLRLNNDIVRELLEAEIALELDEGTAEITQVDWLLGGSFAMRATEAALDRVESRLARLEAETVRHARLAIRIEERLPGAREGRVVGALECPVPLAQPVALGAYRNAAIVADQDVEVAEKSQISDPVIGSALAGLLANVVVAPGAERSFSVALEMRVMTFDDPRLLPFTATDVGSVERVRDRSLYTESRLQVVSGRSAELLLGRSPFTHEPARLVAVVTVD